jgi:putative ABC transport system permease protein
VNAILRKCLGDLRRHRIQALVIGFIVLLASGTGVIALTLMAQSSNPFDTAFAQQNGAHLQAYFDAGKVQATSLPATAPAIGATEYAGPYPSGSIVLRRGADNYPLNLIARDTPDATVDRIRVVAGRWASAADEIVITKSFADLNGIGLEAHVADVNVAGTPLLRVVGEVVDIDEGQADLSTQTAFVSTSAFASLTPPISRGYVMLYRFAGTPTEHQLASAVTALRQAVPAGALGATVDYVLFKKVDGITNSLVLTMLLAFSVFALAAAGLVVANLVTGTVLASYRDIGIMKAVGFTPRQVAAVYVLEMLLPALVGCAIGIPAGMVLSQPLVAQSAAAVGLSSPSTVSPGVALMALVGALLIVALASLVPASRAGRLRAVEAMTRGVTPSRARVSRIGWVATRLRLPDTIVLGCRDAFARPLRGSFTTIAIVVGVASAIFAVGLRSSLDAWAHSLAGDAAVVVSRTAGYSDQQTVTAITRQPGVSAVVGLASVRTAVPGITDQVQTEVFRGDSRRLGLGVVNGTWFTRPGEALAPKATFADAHLHLGDGVTVDYNGTPVRLTMVGEVSSVSDLGHELMVDAGTFPGPASDFAPYTYDVVLDPGADPKTFSRRVEAQSPEFLSAQANDINAGVVGTLDTVGFALAVILIFIALAGAFNTQLLTVRERRGEWATLKAVGMTPRQLVAMVCATGTVMGLIGGLVALPVGLFLHRVLLTLFAAQAGTGLANGVLDVFSPWVLPLFVVIGVAVGVAGGLLPARSAARTPVAVILHAE